MQQEHENPAGKSEDKNRHRTLEVVFISLMGLLTAVAFVRALTYDIVSARAPLVILVPLLILIGLQVKKAWSAITLEELKRDLAVVTHLRNREFNGVAGFFGWMLLLLALIYVTGHYAGIAIFMFFLMYLVAGEKLVLSISVSGSVTLLIYLLFEHLFNIELYRGLIYRIWAGYGVF